MSEHIDNTLAAVEAAVITPPPPAATAGLAKLHVADFFELTKPRMNFLVIVTTAVGYYMAVRHSFQWMTFLQTIFGTALTAAGASVLNQYWERQYDALMERTADRPLPGGRVAPLEALIFGVFLSICGVIYLAVTVNLLTAAIGAATLLSYVLIYTPLKRVTTLCTVVGAVPGALPLVMGWTAATGELSAAAAALFVIQFLWQMPHFLAIAILCKDQYRRAGFRMLPVVDDNLAMTGRQMLLYSLALIPASLMPTALGMTHAVYFATALVLGVALLALAVAARSGRRSDARRLFLASVLYLPLLLGAMMVDKL